jgi:hypothetical protein
MLTAITRCFPDATFSEISTAMQTARHAKRCREPVRSFTLDVRRASGEVTRIDVRIVSRMKSFQRSRKSSRIPAPVAERLRKLGYITSH